MERIYVLDKINLDTDIFLTDMLSSAKLLVNENNRLEEEGWKDVRLEMEYYNEGCELIVRGNRLETDAEYNKRIADIEIYHTKLEKKRQKEYQKYLALKSKYENII